MSKIILTATNSTCTSNWQGPDGRALQPLVLEPGGTVRFRANAIVRALLDTGKLNMNDLASLPFSNEDREQFAQLIGYDVGGFMELNYVSDGAALAAAQMATALKLGNT